MKRKDNCILREICGIHVLIPAGENAIGFSGMIELSETGAFLWEKLSESRSIPELTELVTEAYAVSAEAAEADIRRLTAKLHELNLLAEYEPGESA